MCASNPAPSNDEAVHGDVDSHDRDAYRLLAEAQEQLGDREAALRSHRKGLMLATSPEAKLPQLPPARPA